MSPVVQALLLVTAELAGLRLAVQLGWDGYRVPGRGLTAPGPPTTMTE